MYNKLMSKLKLIGLICSVLIIMVSYQNCSPLNSATEQFINGQSVANVADSQKSTAMAVLTAKCLSCHSSSSPAAGIDVANVDEMLLSGVIVPSEPSLSPLFTSIQSGTMPPGQALSQFETQAISTWIQDGLKTPPVIPTPSPSPAVVPLAANFNSININILKPKCLGCHNSTSSAGGVSYSTYITTKNTVQAGLPASSSLYTSTAVAKTMPKAGPLSTAEIKAINDWIVGGALNN